MRLELLPNKNIKAYYSVTKTVLNLYDSNQKYIDCWQFEPSIIKEFKGYISDTIGDLAAQNTVKGLLKRFYSNYDITSNTDATHEFISGNKTVYIKMGV